MDLAIVITLVGILVVCLAIFVMVARLTSLVNAWAGAWISEMEHRDLVERELWRQNQQQSDLPRS